jgi:hypothetical protein
MPGQYSTKPKPRPRRSRRSPWLRRANAQAWRTYPRLIVCVRCRRHAVICSRCDRGQIYCSPACAREARRQSLRAANKRYAATSKGRMARAKATAGWRVRKNKVIDQSSPQPPSDGLLSGSLAVKKPPSVSDYSRPSPFSGGLCRCCWCGRCCPASVRRGFLRRRAHRTFVQHGDRGAADDHPP